MFKNEQVCIPVNLYLLSDHLLYCQIICYTTCNTGNLTDIIVIHLHGPLKRLTIIITNVVSFGFKSKIKIIIFLINEYRRCIR